MQPLGFSLQENYCLPQADVVRLLRQVGFAAVSPTWQPGEDLKQIVHSCERHGMALQSLHGPFRGLPDMWSTDARLREPIIGKLLQALEDCAALGFPIMVVHSWGGLNYCFREEALCFDSFDLLVERADRYGVRIAFENLEGPEYLDALMSRYREAPVGLCWDSGHELCYTPSRDFLKSYGDRLMVTHLNDNLGITAADGHLQGPDDLHLLPGDGVTDWKQIMTRLQQAQPQKILNFELKIRPKGDRCTHDLYSELPLEEYFLQAYRKASQAVLSTESSRFVHSGGVL